MRILISLFVLLAISGTSFSQEDARINRLLDKVEVELKRFDTNTIISNTNEFPSDKRVVFKGQNGQYTFRNVIKYYNGGMKKEKIQIFKFNAWGRSVLICMLVKINEQIFYVEYIETDENKVLSKKTKEVYIANKCYQKTTYDGRGYTASTESCVLPLSLTSKP